MLRIQCAIDGHTVAVEHAVGAHLVPPSRPRPRVQVDAGDGGDQQVDEAELQFDGDRIAGDPQQKVRQPRQVGQVVDGGGGGFLFGGGGGSGGGRVCVRVGIGER